MRHELQLGGIKVLWLVRWNIVWGYHSLQWIEGSHNHWESPSFCRGHLQCPCTAQLPAQIKQFMGPTWGPPGSCRPQMGPMLAPWTLLSGKQFTYRYVRESYEWVRSPTAPPRDVWLIVLRNYPVCSWTDIWHAISFKNDFGALERFTPELMVVSTKPLCTATV